MKIDLLVASPDEGIVDQCLRSWFHERACSDIRVRASNPAQVVRHMATGPPDVLLLEDQAADPGFPPPILAQVLHQYPDTRVLMLCDSPTQETVVGLIRQGASGCLFKSGPPALFPKAVRAVHAGEPWFGRRALLQALQTQISHPAAHPIADGVLTKREEQILRLIGSALSNKEIARQLKISDKTVKTHLHHIYVKLNQSGRYKALLSQPDGHAVPIRS